MCINNKTVSWWLSESKQLFTGEQDPREKRQQMKLLLLQVLNCQIHEFIPRSNDLLTDNEEKELERLLFQINKGAPVQYVLGKTFFFDDEFRVDKRALIPRPETEELVSETIARLNESDNLEILDIGTGTGCIALSLKKVFMNASVTGIDISKDCIDLAVFNSKELKRKVEFQVFDILSETPQGSYNLIISNPPYIPFADKNQMEENVLNYEPHEALFVPDHDPILFYKRIIDLGLTLLKKNGYLAFEIHENLAKEVEKYLNLKDYSNIEVVRDLQGKERMIFAQLS